MISINFYGRLGNHLWQYAVCRTVAEYNNYQFHIPRDFAGAFLNCDYGVAYDHTNKVYPFNGNHDGKQTYDKNLFNVEDNTRLDGYFQSEKYIVKNRENILKWFNIQENTKVIQDLNLDENTCIINFRGGDYANLKHVFLDQKYYTDSINALKNIKENLRFIVVTDDLNLAKSYFPHLDIYHFDVATDFMLIAKASYLIIPNSTFSWWGAWLNTNVKITIAPKYWLRHNISEGWWMPSDSLTTRFHYIDREGILSNYEECLNNITDLNYLDHY